VGEEKAVKPVAIIQFAERKNKRDPLAVFIVTVDRIVATGAPGFAASRDCDSWMGSLNALPEDERRAEIDEFRARQQRPNVNALPPEGITPL
jgi:hypothetical protein